MMPEAMLPTTPSASTIWRRSSFERGGDAGRGADRAEHRGRVEAGLVHELRRDEAQPAQRFHADGDARQRCPAVRR